MADLLPIVWDSGFKQLSGSNGLYIPASLLIGAAGPRLKNDSGTLAVRNAGDTDYANIAAENISATGTGTNYLYGQTVVGTGSTPVAGQTLIVGGEFTGDANSRSVVVAGTVQSDVTTGFVSYISTIGTEAASFTLPQLYHHHASQGTFGAGSTVTSQYGYSASSSLTGATNNYGFYGAIPSGTGRWNIYMVGTAANYIAGELLLGSTLSFEGATADAYETTFGVVDPTADRTINLPNNSGTVLLDADIGTTSGTVAAGNHTHTGTYEPADATILKSAAIGTSVQAHDPDTTKNDVANTFTQNQTLIRADAAAAWAVIGDAQTSGFNATRYADDGGSPQNQFIKYRGSIASPSAVVANDRMLALNGYVWDGSTELFVCALRGSVSAIAGVGDVTSRMSIVTKVGSAAVAEALAVVGNDVGIGTTSPATYGKLAVAGGISPTVDNSYDLGSGTYRMRTIYAGTGTINTSDAREKTPVRALTAAEIAAAQQLAAEVGAYQFLSAVAEKGGAAREHIGMTVQRAIEIMEAHGLNPYGYGFICYDVWDRAVIEHPAIDADPESGTEAVAAWTEVATEAGDRYSFRPDELNLFIARGFDARLSALESVMQSKG